MLNSTIQINCLDENTLCRIASGECSFDELSDCEAHVSHCERCRELLESRAIDDVWREQLLPAFQETKDGSLKTMHWDTACQAALNLLGPTDDPYRLGRIGSYEVVSLIGIGGMGVVFKAFDAGLNRFVAIKMMQPHLAVSGAARQRFEREGRAAAAVVNDYVLPIYAVAEWQGVPYLVMQYTAGMNLQRRIDVEGPLKLSETLRIAMQTARGLAAAHAQGLVHRDVKPSNILLDGSVERAMLTDFGLARAVDDASVTRTGLIAGTPQYMSPEQVRGDKIDSQSDLFSLGSTMYAMSTGHPPFRSDSSYAILRRIIDDTPRSIREINSDVPLWFEHIVSKLLAKHPRDRFDSAEQVAGLLESCLSHLQKPDSSPLPTIIADLMPSQVKRPFAKFFIALGLFISLMFAGVLFVLETNKGTLTIESDANDVPIRIMQNDKVIDKMTVSREGKTTRIASGEYRVEIEHDFANATITDDVVAISRGGVNIVRITSKPIEKEAEKVPPSEPENQEKISTTFDTETGTYQIRGKSREKVQRAANVMNEFLAQLAKNGDESKRTDSFRKLFDTIAAPQQNSAPNPFPIQLFLECFAEAPKQLSEKSGFNPTYAFKSIQNIERSTQSDSIVVYEFDLDGLSFCHEVAELTFGGSLIADEILDSMLSDSQGPKVDARKILRESIGKRVKLVCDFSSGEKMGVLVRFSLVDQVAFMPMFRRFFEKEPDLLSNESKDFYVSSHPSRLTWGARVFNHHLYWGTLNMLEGIRESDQFMHFENE